MKLNVLIGNDTVNWTNIEDCEGSLDITNEEHSSFNQFLKISSGEEYQLIPEKYQNISKNFVSSSYAAPLLMPRSELKSSLSKAEKFMRETILDEKNKDYLKNWVKIDSFLKQMKRVKIDESQLKTLISQKSDLNPKTFLSFMPQNDGLANPVSYDTSASVTGRLTVLKGPQILTTDHTVRSLFKSVYDGGKIYSVDFVSIEPRIAMILGNKSTQNDVYQDLLEEFPDLTRDQAKLITLTAMFGGSELKVAETIGNLQLAKKAISFVRYNFGIDDLEKRLDNEANCGMIRNVLGRPLREATKNKRIRTNHFLQSSAAEVAILLFSELCEKFSKGVRPMFVIVDALIVDVSPDFDDEFIKMSKSISWKNVSMPVKIEVLSHN
jgi:hypothetical protein